MYTQSKPTLSLLEAHYAIQAQIYCIEFNFINTDPIAGAGIPRETNRSFVAQHIMPSLMVGAVLTWCEGQIRLMNCHLCYIYSTRIDAVCAGARREFVLMYAHRTYRQYGSHFSMFRGTSDA